MAWKIENHLKFEWNTANYITSICQLTLNHLSSKLNFTPPLGEKTIILKYNCGYPLVFWPLKSDRYEIGITVDSKFPHQIIYQMAHELCHVFADPRFSGVFMEIICHKTSFDVLEDIGAPLTELGRSSVNHYFETMQMNAEATTSVFLSDMDTLGLIDLIKKIEKTKDLNSNRPYFDLIALKFKELYDHYGKYGFIKFVKDASSPKPSKDLSDLTTINELATISFESLIKNISIENIELSTALKKDLFN